MLQNVKGVKFIMPPKSKCTREQIIETTFRTVRKEGLSSLKARRLAEELGTSTAPIFTAFKSIEEIRDEVVKKANALYGEYIKEGLKQTPAFKGAGMKYIEFAKDEPELFKILNINKNFIDNFLPAYDDNSPEVMKVLENKYGMSNETAKKLYNHMSVYAFGFASLYAQRMYLFTMEDISRMMSEVYKALEEKFGE